MGDVEGDRVTVAVCVPFRPRNNHESIVWSWVRAWWATVAPDWDVIVADSGHEPFNRSASRNAAAAQIGDDVDVVIFSNSDTVTCPARLDLDTAVAIARDGGWTLPAVYVETAHAWTREVLTHHPIDADLYPFSHHYDRQLERSVAGPQIMGRALFEDVGGWDERFTGWGWEDRALVEALTCLHGPPTYTGTAVHLWHERGRAEWPQSNQDNRQRWAQHYQRAARDGPAAMRHLLNKRP